MKYFHLILPAVAFGVPAAAAAQSYLKDVKRPPLQYYDCGDGGGPRWITAEGADTISTVLRNGKQVPAVLSGGNYARPENPSDYKLVPKDTIAVICEEPLKLLRVQDSLNRIRLAAQLIENERTAKVYAAKLAHEDSAKAADEAVRARQEAADRKVAIAKAAKARADFVASVRSHGWSERVVDAILAKKIFVGMTDEQTRLSWGRPQSINSTVTASTVHEQWVYGSGYYVYFTNGELTSYQTSH